MNGLLQLAGLVALAFFASAAVERDRRGLGVAGLYVLLGVLLGPLGLSLFDEDLRPLIPSVCSLCVIWLALLFGIRLRAGALARLRPVGAVAAVIETGGTLLVVLVGLTWIAPRLGLKLSPLGLSGVAIASAASSQAVVRAARARFQGPVPWAPFLDGVSGVDDLVPIGAVLAMAVLWPGRATPALLSANPWTVVAAVVVLGGLLGAVYGLATGAAPSKDRGWLVLLGAAFLGAGVASQLGLPEIAVGLAAGLAVAQIAEGRLLAGVVSASERPVTLLLLVLVGARFAPSWPVLQVAALALGLRLIGKLAAGPALVPLGGQRADLGLGLLGYGGLALACAMQIDLLYGPTEGTAVLVVAAVQAVFGDLLGPLGLNALARRSAAAPIVVAAEAVP